METAAAEEKNQLVEIKFLEDMIFQGIMKLSEKIEPNKQVEKALVFPQELRILITTVIDVNLLREKNYKIQFYSLDDSSLNQFNDASRSVMIYFCPPDIRMVQQTVKIAQSYSFKRVKKQHFLVFYPQRTFMIKYDLKRESFLSFFEGIFDFNFSLIPFGKHLMSLAYQPSLSELFVSNEYNCHNMVAESLYRLETIFGSFKTIMLKGTPL